MPEFDHAELADEYDSFSDKKEGILDKLRHLVLESKESLEGNAFCLDASLNLYPRLFTKQVNLFWSGKQATTRICEIGFNAGHSTMLLLLGRDTSPVDFTIFDIGTHRYTRPCVSYIQSVFPHVKFEYIEGDSTATMPSWIDTHKELIGSYDVIHVDGGHSEHCIINDMKNTDLLVKLNGIVIIDDTNLENHPINRCVDMYISTGRYVELDIIKTECYPHRILRKIL
jgi:hypothetical protein